MDREEWSGPYEHDGKGCPVKGCWVRVVRRNGETDEFKKTPDGNWQEGMAKPCVGCMKLIANFGITRVEWTNG